MAVAGAVGAMVGAVVALDVGVTVVVVAGAANSTSLATRNPCSLTPVTRTMSPRLSPLLFAKADCIDVII